MKLHEVGLYAANPEASRRFYHDILGLRLDHEEPGLAVFDGGWPGLEIGACSGYTDRVHISFIVDEVARLASELRTRGVEFEGPADVHLGMRGIVLTDPDGLRVLIHSPTGASPDWLRKMVK